MRNIKKMIRRGRKHGLDKEAMRLITAIAEHSHTKLEAAAVGYSCGEISRKERWNRAKKREAKEARERAEQGKCED